MRPSAQSLSSRAPSPPSALVLSSSAEVISRPVRPPAQAPRSTRAIFVTWSCQPALRIESPSSVASEDAVTDCTLSAVPASSVALRLVPSPSHSSRCDELPVLQTCDTHSQPVPHGCCSLPGRPFHLPRAQPPPGSPPTSCSVPRWRLWFPKSQHRSPAVFPSLLPTSL